MLSCSYCVNPGVSNELIVFSCIATFSAVFLLHLRISFLEFLHLFRGLFPELLLSG